MKVFYTGPLVNAELLVAMLEKHGITASFEPADAGAPEEQDLNRVTQVFVPEGDFDRAHRLFYSEREDEL